MIRLLLAGGGSIGHISPCLAVARELEKLLPQNTDLQVLHVCSASHLEREMLSGKATNIILAPKLRRYFSVRTVVLPVEFLVALVQASLILLRFKPHVILATGGSVGMSVCLASALRRIPIVLFEPDAAPGIATRVCWGLAKVVCVGQESKGAPKCVHTGVPVREEITKGSRDGGRAITGLSGNRPVLLVLGGSQGARAINDVVYSILPNLLSLCDVVHITGKGKGLHFEHARYIPFEFVAHDFPNLLALADFALTRAGASALAELAAVGLPAIICPLPGSAQDHQRRNAQRFEERGAAVVMEQEELKTNLLPVISSLLEDEQKRHDMKEKMQSLHSADAGRTIAEMVLRAVGSAT
jgi:UDP-N-acetylglucosamine--N-acetylmuramyl-(pentapeptide) pyrophosphoryl-undecaprenol N-acetylglucosamine transferase